MKTSTQIRKLDRPSNPGVAPSQSGRPAPAGRRQAACRKAGWLLLVAGLWAVNAAHAQSSITQNNLIQNGGFDSGGTGWTHTGGGGAYFYSAGLPNPDNETNTICSYGWWTGYALWQNTGSPLQASLDYVATIRVRTGDGNMGGVNLSVQDPSTGWTVLTNQDFWLPDADKGQNPGPWHIYSFRFNSADVPGNVGDQLAVAVTMETNVAWGPQYGWLHVDWVQLAPALPFFAAQPQSITNYAGAAVAFNGSAVGAVTNATGPGSRIQYQWYLAPATLLPAATNAMLSFSALNATNAGDYFVVATGPFGSSQSSNATLTVLPANPPIVTTPPQSLNAYPHQTVSFSVGVDGTPPFTYQWASNSIALAGATNATLTLTNISAASAGTYSVGVTNAFGGSSTNAILTVLTPTPGTYEAAVVDLQPQVYLRFSDLSNTNRVLNEGALGAAADGTAEGAYVATSGPLPPSYPNFEDTNSAVQCDGYDTDVAIPPLQLATNAGNTISMSAWIYCYGPQTAYSGILFERDGGASGLQIQTDVNGNNVLSYDWANGGFWQFSSGLIIPQYQWCFVALVITPTNSTLYLQDGVSMQTAVNTATHGLNSFTGTTAVGWDAAGGTTGRRFNGMIDEAAIFNRSLSPTDVNALFSAAVGSPAGIVTSPAGVTNFTGQPFQLTVVASGAPPLSFQWFKDNSPIPNATNDTYAVAAAALTNSGDYYVYVQNTAGNTNSAVATVSIVTSAPFFTLEPQPTNVWAGVPVTLTGAANGSLPLTYQWYKNDVLQAGQTNASLTLADPEAGDAGSYVLRASSSYGQTNSPGVQLTVQDPAQSAQMLYYTNTTSTWNLRNNYQPIQGAWFQTGNKSRVVTHLGYFDSTGAGLLTNHWVGIYQGPPGSGTLMAQVQVQSGTTDQYLNGFRWVALSTPFTLLANTNYVLAASDNNWDLWPDAYLPTWNPAYLGVTAGSTRYPVYDSSLVAWPHEPNTPITSWGLNLTYGAFNLGSFPLTLTGSGTTSQLTWTIGTLVSSPNVAGPYLPVTGATSPYTMPLTGAGQYYRLQY